jgi:hypothetical protein
LFVGVLATVQADAQVRGLYPPGMTATNSGVLPEAGLTYTNLFQLYSFDKLKGPERRTITDDLSSDVFIDQNLFTYVTTQTWLGGEIAFIVSLPFANTSHTLADQPLGGGGGFAQSFFAPVFGWTSDRSEIIAGYGLLADTGDASAGYWGNSLLVGDTFYLTSNKALAFSSYQIYEFHTEKDSTDVTPGQSLSVDYSLTMTVPVQEEMKSLIQFGFAGYGQWQTTDNGGPGATPVTRRVRYGVNAAGVAFNVILPPKGVTLMFRYFNEYRATSTVEGDNVQISVSVTF